MTRRRLLPLLIVLLFPALHGIDPVTLDVYDPPERALWIELHDQYPGLTHFYSDDNFVHQLYAGVPQLIRWRGETVTGLVITGKDGAFTVTMVEGE